MDKLKYAKVLEKNEIVERRFADFQITSIFALIAANWAIIQLIVKEGLFFKSIIFSVICSVAFLFIHGVRSKTLSMHYREVLKKDKQNPDSVSDSSAKQSCYGKTADVLANLNIIVLILAYFSFIFGACKFILQK
tara:strand:- start:3614 stop:4018 length:405 start_codon:yes stop_codon:yes gene_type:complete